MSGTSTPPPEVLRSIHASHRFGTARAVGALVLREMATTYGRSPGGYIWAILEPLAGITVMTFVFSLMLRTPPLGINFPIFYATGMLPFTMYIHITQRVQTAINYSRPLLAYPTVTFLDAILARFLLALVTKLLVSYILFAGICTLFETRTVLDLSAIALGFTMLAVLALGIGTLNCVLVSIIPLWDRLWGIAMAPLMILSCVFYTFDMVPASAQTYLWFNPMLHVIGQIRSGFYPGYDASYVSPTYVFLCGLVPMVLGLIFLRRWHRLILSRG
ncbi:ABC transporter permease [Falsirhodobacter sp. 1013]|uniref:ABC transporter permease n=1 Tax=Falsirhodobacter sp. 1013 TaxID=3417566 RepID=UPI003EB77CA6